MNDGFRIELDKAGVRSEILQAEWTKAIIWEMANSEKKNYKDATIKQFKGFDRQKAIIKGKSK